MHKVEILYFLGCPNYRKSCDVVCKVFQDKNIEFELTIRPINEKTLAKNPHFYGSPTILIDGIEVETCFTKQYFSLSDVDGLACRLYDCEISKECPSEEMILCALN